MKLIDKDQINELRKLYNDIDSCISDLVVARSKRDDKGIAAAHWQMETLMVNTQQTISHILDTLELKEVIAEQECICNEALNRIIGGSWNLLCPVNKLGLKNGDKVKVIIKAQKGE